MIVIFLLIPMSIIVAGVFLFGFIWAVKSGQFEDTCTPALRVLSEDSNRKTPADANADVRAECARNAPADHTQIAHRE